MTQLAAWWRARTSRERLLVQIAAVLVFAILAPGWAYMTAAKFRQASAADLVNARQVSAQVSQLAETLRAQGGGAQGSIRERALAAAQAVSLTPARLEDAGAGRLRIVFEAADSVAIYRWIEAAGRRGAAVARTTITRVGASDQVNAEFELVEGP